MQWYDDLRLRTSGELIQIAIKKVDDDIASWMTYMSRLYSLFPSIMQDGWTPLALACDMGNSKVVKILLDYGADVNQQNDVSETDILYTYYFGKNVYCLYRCHPNLGTL